MEEGFVDDARTQAEVLSALERRGVHKRNLFYRSEAAGDGRLGSNGEVGGRRVDPPRPRDRLQPCDPCPPTTIKRAKRGCTRPRNRVQPRTLKAYAEAKGLPVEFLKQLGLSKISYSGSPAVRIPYFDEDGAEGAVHLRLALEKSPQRDYNSLPFRGAHMMFRNPKAPTLLPIEQERGVGAKMLSNSLWDTRPRRRNRPWPT